MRARRAAEVVVGVIFLLPLYTMFAVRQYYTRHMPSSPDPVASRVVAADVNYGRTVYVTEAEKQRLHLAYLAAAGGGIIFLGFVVWRSGSDSR